MPQCGQYFAGFIKLSFIKLLQYGHLLAARYKIIPIIASSIARNIFQVILVAKGLSKAKIKIKATIHKLVDIRL